MVVNQTLTVDGVEYTFGADGVAVVNAQDSDEQSESTDETQVTSDDATVAETETSSAE